MNNTIDLDLEEILSQLKAMDPAVVRTLEITTKNEKDVLPAQDKN